MPPWDAASRKRVPLVPGRSRMTLLIREREVRALLPMAEAVRLVREALSSQRSMGGRNLARRRLDLDHGVLNVMAASVPSAKADGLKAYTVTRTGARFLVALWDRDSGRLVALVEADWLGRIRTGAASGVATDALADAGASVLAVIGAGNQARTQIEAIASVRDILEVRVFSRSPDRRSQFAADVQQELGLPVRSVASAQQAATGADIIVTITSAAEPVLDGEWLRNRCHVNAAGSNHAKRRELATNVLERATLIAVDSMEQAHIEAGDLLIPVDEGSLSWERVVELGDVLNEPNHASRGITVFKSLGVAVEDVAVARYVYDRAVSEGLGERTSFGEAEE